MSDDRDGRRADGGRGSSQPPNVKPKIPQNSKEQQMRKERPERARRSRSSDSERGRRRERQQQPGERRLRRGRSEEARGRTGPGERRRRTTKPLEDEEVEEPECAVCFCSYDNVFKTPKLLSCGHTFCLECLARINVSSPELKSLSCPVCRELTDLPHGQDLPRLGNNQDIISRLPAGMQRALSIRFKRSKGKLVLKNPASLGPAKPTTAAAPVLSLPVKPPEQEAADGAAGQHGRLELGEVEHGLPPATVVDVGRPPNRMRGRLRRLVRSDRCYYAVVGSIISITVVLMLVGILAFVIVPTFSLQQRPPPNNQTANRPPPPP